MNPPITSTLENLDLAERAAVLTIIEEEGSVLHAVIQTSVGPVTVIANVTRETRRLVLSQIHVEGKGLATAVIKEAAKELAVKEDADEVILHGGVRTSGASPGRIPKPIEVRVDQ